MLNRAESVLEERLGFLFQPDVLIPAQYFDALRSKTGMEPEKRLMLAVLEDAVRCYQNNLAPESEIGRKSFEDAEEWLMEEGGDWAFSFESICEALGLNPEYVRQGLSRWKRKNLARRRNAEAWEKIMKEPLKRTA
ncbi:MAG: hypothetical protein ACREQP_04985 [Candidatus Binatia bacterium]